MSKVGPKEFGLEHGSEQVLLISLPWTTLTEPSLGLSLLKSILARENISSRVMHLNLFLLRHVQSATYFSIANVYALNDFLFSHPLAPEITNKQHRLLRHKVRELLDRGRVIRFGGEDAFVENLIRLRNEIIPQFLREIALGIAAAPARLIGFTCMFDQTIASLALAKLIGESAPDKLLALGGYGVRSPAAEMLVASSPWIDAVCTGEGETTIVELYRAANGEMPLNEVQGIAYRERDGQVVSTPPPPLADLAANPTPDFDDFFRDIEQLSRVDEVDIQAAYLPLENSRGCWWGQKSHCIFCGIKNSDLAFRWRPAAKTLAQMEELSRRYGILAFRFSDYILPYEYYKTLLPELAARGAPFRLFGEIKANVSRERFRLLHEGGFEEVQPGIESFSSSVLARMGKGVTAIQNVFTLLQGRALGVEVRYNLLYGFPDDQLEEYIDMARLLPRIVHLDSPVSYVPVQITRYAPMQEYPERFGIEKAVPDPTFELVFSDRYIRDSGFDISAYCYYFQRPFENSSQLSKIYSDLQYVVEDWRIADKDQAYWLYGEAVGEDFVIHDKRSSREERVYTIKGSLSEMLHACTEPTHKRDLAKLFGEDRVDEMLEELDELRLIFIELERVISLLLPCKPAPRRPPYFLRSVNAKPPSMEKILAARVEEAVA